MDRNTVIGFVLIGILLIGMFVINSRSQLAFEGEKKRKEDSILASKPKVIIDPVTAGKDARLADSLKRAAQPVTAFQAPTATEQKITLENDVLQVTFTNKGAQPQEVILKKYKKYDSTLVHLQASNFNKISYLINTGTGTTAQSADIIFTAQPVTKNADGSQSLSFVTSDSTGKEITHQYTLRPSDYMIDLTISVKGSDQLFSQNTLSINWQTEADKIERDHKYELTQSNIGYLEDGKYDFEHVKSGGSESFSKPVDWIGVKQQFFVSALLAKNKFSSVATEWKVPEDTTSYMMQTTTIAKVNLPAGNVASVPLQLYYGPSDYNILKRYNNNMENMVPYGSGVFSFVKYINRHFLLPVFDFLQRHIASMGIVILLLTLLIRLITSPILYKSYLSGAKMKVLKPEVDALKAKFTNPKTNELDQQAFSMEQMKLWRTAGVSPLGGCLPALLQIPIFMSLYYFFQSNIDLRGKNFLWASDLATYDSIAKLPFSIPFYGDHVSLFTLTAVITSLIISIYSMSNMQDNTNPVMKYMPYIFPVLLLGVFNNLPAALTWYYTISNSITLILQIVIQKYIINHEKILAQISENRKKPVKKSKLAERMEAMQEAQKKLQDQKKGTTKK